MNENDAERLRMFLESVGLKEVNKEDKADIIIGIMCSVRQRPVDRIWGKLKIWQNLKNKPKIFLTGCITKTDKEKMSKKADLIFNILDLKRLFNFLKKENLISKKPKEFNFFKIKPKRFKKEKVYIALGTGCNNFCTYCVVPHTRGREIYRPFKEIEKEIEEAIRNGAKTITLIAQNVNSFKLDKEGKKYLLKKYGQKPDFVLLLYFINDLEGNFKVEFLTSHPKDMSDELIEAISKLNKVSKWIHLPLQSGDDKILKMMNRKYTAKEYVELVKKIRKKIPNVLLTTDIIVGFPQEGEEEFKNTQRIVKVCKFDQAFISCYSPRPGTLASKMKDDVPLEEKKRRLKILEELINKKRKKENPWQVAEKANKN